ncbi:MAG: hypothetical protein ACJ8AD_09875, partial [Gemmatimonadaceae bacterium]
LIIVLIGCTKRDAPLNDTTVALAPAPSDSTTSTASVTPAAPAPVRGTLTSVSDTALTISTASGDVQVRITPPLNVYTRTASDLAHVTPTSFVGVTSVPAADGSQKATEIHVFPEELRGTGEGSRLMTPAAGGSSASTMTNGSVAASRMTNGTVGANATGSSITVRYQGASRTIAVPADVKVTAITATKQKLAPGASVVVLASKGPDGVLSASTVMLAPK